MVGAPAGLTDQDARMLLHRTRLDHGDVGQFARSVLQDPTAQVACWWVEPVDYAFASPTTGGLLRIRGDAAAHGGQRAWSIFVKLLHSYRHWQVLPLLPPELREQALHSNLWRYEADVYARGLGAALPQGLRLPRVHRVQDVGDDRMVVVLEDVQTASTPWDATRFARAGHLLGRLAARLTRLDALPASAFRVPGQLTRLHHTSRLLVAALPALADDATWAHPALAAAERGLRPDLTELARRVPSLLDTLARLPQVLVHGDASPQNLLVPADQPDTFVAIDWTLGGLAAAGDDLGQLLVGLAHAGQLSPSQLPGLREAVVPAFTAGLLAEGLPVSEADVRYGADGGLVVRSAFTALPLNRLREPMTEELARVIESRLRLTRYLVDLGLELPQ